MDFSHPDFRPLREVDLPAIRAFAREFEHEPSGARLLHLETTDTENCFALAFPTPPDADHGVPHILEHAVLAGSERFPVREPFFEMIKSSPAGFINAMTSESWTIYPICTTLEGDFFNLAEVYADAVFSPMLTRETFEREGHHLKLERPGDLDSPLQRSGIVYNEMKGAFSSPEALLYRSSRRLFPGGTLGFESGGDPAAIPQLSWEVLREFHARFYAPGNCLLVLYGDIPLEKQLDYWGRKLSGLGRAPSLAARASFDQWDAPRREEEPYAVEPDSDTSERTLLSLRWRCGDALDPFTEMSWEVLERLLAGHDAAPLKKALIDSKLGADVETISAQSFESEQMFHIALKGSERERAAEFEAFTLETLRQIADAGFSPEEIETALRRVAYSTLEVSSLFPLRLAMNMARLSSSGGEPLDATHGREVLEAVRQRASEDADFFPRLIREGLLENSHRLLMTLYPDPEHGARLEEREREELARLKSTLSEDELRRIDENAQKLEESQGQPNPPEALATLPRLKKSDLPDAPREAATQVLEVAGFPVVRSDVFSNGVVYVQAGVDVRDLPPHLWKYLPRFTDAFEKMGAAGQSWEQIAARRAAVTGRLGAHPTAYLHAQSRAPIVDLRFHLKTLDSDVDAALDLFADLAFELEAGDRERLHDVQTQGVAQLRSDLVLNALGAALNCGSRGQSPIGWLPYLWESPLTYRWMRHMTEDFEAHAGKLIQGIEEVREWMRDRSRWTWSFTGSDEAFERFQGRLASWSTRANGRPLSEASPSQGEEAWDGGGAAPALIGLAAPVEVQFCARVLPAPAEEVAPLFDLGMSLLSYDYLLPEIRFKGNAYGGGGFLNRSGGTTAFYSFRDPLLNETLEVFDGCAAWVEAQNWTDDDLERALLGNVRGAVPSIRPAEATGSALDRLRRGQSASMRADEYRRKLSATPGEVKSVLLDYLSDAMPRGTAAVAASRSALERANESRAEAGQAPFTIEEMLP
jgi:Zn-dependent M16 (insulinase) family peptidase